MVATKAKKIANLKIKNAKYYDKCFSNIKEISVPQDTYESGIPSVYCFRKRRDQLLKYCLKGIEAKVHYPKPMYLQKNLKYLKYKKGDFPITDRHTKEIITFPCDQHLSKKQLKYVIKTVKDFYKYK